MYIYVLIWLPPAGAFNWTTRTYSMASTIKQSPFMQSNMSFSRLHISITGFTDLTQCDMVPTYLQYNTASTHLPTFNKDSIHIHATRILFDSTTVNQIFSYLHWRLVHPCIYTNTAFTHVHATRLPPLYMHAQRVSINIAQDSTQKGFHPSTVKGFHIFTYNAVSIHLHKPWFTLIYT